MTVKGRIGTPMFIEFFKVFLHNAERIIFLIVDVHHAHESKSVTRFIESVKDSLRLFFLPSYLTELNPDERAWNDLKNNVVSWKSIDSPKHLHKLVLSNLRLVQESPDRVRSYFQNKTTNYAA